MLSIGWLLLALACETLAVAVLFQPASTQHQLGVFALAHLLASFAFSRLLPARFAVGKRAAGLVLAFSLFIPVFGALGMAASLWMFSRSRKEKKPSKYLRIPFLQFPGRKPRAAATLGEGGAWSRLRARELPWSRRLEALMAVDASSGGDASRLLQWAAGDGDDEVRLLAFHLLDGREKQLSAGINRALARLKRAGSAQTRAELCSTLAYAYWELVYNELAEEELLQFYLAEALRFANQAEELGGGSMPLALLRARLHLRCKDLPKAEQALNQALELGAPPDKAVPYQAELLYLQRDFASLRQLFVGAPLLSHKPRIGPVATFWCEG